MMRGWTLLSVLPGNTLKHKKKKKEISNCTENAQREWKSIILTGSLSLSFLHLLSSLVPLSLLFVAATCVFRCVRCPCLSHECIHIMHHLYIYTRGSQRKEKTSANFWSELLLPPVGNSRAKRRGVCAPSHPDTFSIIASSCPPSFGTTQIFF